MKPTPPKTSVARPEFIELNGRRLFGLRILPTGPCTGAVLYLPSIAEEMNRYRSHVAAQARALAAVGFQSLLLDPYGTGESEGALEDADWDSWQADARAACDWLHRQGGQPLTLWGVRTGALLAAELAVAAPVPIAQLLLWQPVLDGKLFLNQYLRLRIASQMVSAADRETTESIQARLRAGEVLEVAGYPLSAALAEGLAARRLADMLAQGRQRVAWVEVVSKPEQPLSAPSRKLIETLRAAGTTVDAEAVACPMLWQTNERVEAPGLIEATLRLMGDAR